MAPRVPHRSHAHARLHHLIRIVFAFVAQDVILIRDNEGRRKSRKFVQRSLQWEAVGFFPRRDIRRYASQNHFIAAFVSHGPSANSR